MSSVSLTRHAALVVSRCERRTSLTFSSSRSFRKPSSGAKSPSGSGFLSSCRRSRLSGGGGRCPPAAVRWVSRRRAGPPPPPPPSRGGGLGGDQHLVAL